MNAPKISRFSTRLTHDPARDVVQISLFGRVGGSTHRRRRLASSITVRRSDLRLLCDLIHDYADELDREGAFGSLEPDSSMTSAGSVLSLPVSDPHRAHARESEGSNV